MNFWTPGIGYEEHLIVYVGRARILTGLDLRVLVVTNATTTPANFVGELVHTFEGGDAVNSLQRLT